MNMVVQCNGCGKKLRVGPELAGRSVRCPACNKVLTLPPAAQSVGIAERPQEGRADSSLERSRRPRASVRNQGNAPLILGFVALFVGMLALAFSWAATLRVLMLVIALLGLAVGIVGMVLASRQKGNALGLSIAGGSANVLALLVVSILLIVSRDKPRDSDDPQNPKVGKEKELGWGQATDPDGDCTIRQADETVTIQIPATAHDLSIELNRINAPRVMKEVEGDFRAEVQVMGSLRPPVASNVPGRVAYQAGGLLLWSDDRNYVRLERAGMNRGGAVQNMLAFEMRTNGLTTGAPAIQQPDFDHYLRLERRGNQLLAACSLDGKQWTSTQPFTMPLPAKVRIGVTAVNSALAPLTLRFEGFQVGP